MTEFDACTSHGVHDARGRKSERIGAASLLGTAPTLELFEQAVVDVDCWEQPPRAGSRRAGPRCVYSNNGVPGRVWAIMRSIERQRSRGRRAIASVAAALCITLLLVNVAAADVEVHEFPAGTLGTPVGITAGPLAPPGGTPEQISAQDDLWFTDFTRDTISRISPTGSVRLAASLPPGSSPLGITAARDGNLWYTDWTTNHIGRLTPTGHVDEFPLATPDAHPDGIAASTDGTLWFTEFGSDCVGTITPGGKITECAAALAHGSEPDGITAGRDGDVWFTEAEGDRIGRVAPSHELKEFGLPAGTGPTGITTGPDGNVWFTERSADRIGRLTPDGHLAQFDLAYTSPQAIAAGSDGNLWFTETDAVGRVTPSGTVTEFTAGITPSSGPFGMAIGNEDGDPWFTENLGNHVARVAWRSLRPTPAPGF
ncbi:hypothetical protein AYO39_01430 [Actinobacteria bacterium SCGC AG-212-D09]|nr:hypothetical protein AYO39_01430 [Actinobacteria bacterium SCGC AG-212-D09]